MARMMAHLAQRQTRTAPSLDHQEPLVTAHVLPLTSEVLTLHLPLRVVLALVRDLEQSAARARVT